MNQQLESTLRCLTSNNPTDWSQYLTWIEYAHNSLKSASTGLSPFLSVISLHFSLQTRERSQSDQSISTSVVARESGRTPSPPSTAHMSLQNASLTPRDARPLTTPLAKRYGSLHETFPSRVCLESCPPGSLVLTRLPRSSTPLLYVYTFLRVSASIPRSMSPCRRRSVDLSLVSDLSLRN